MIEPSEHRRGALLSPCPSPETLGRLADASSSASNFGALEAHVEACTGCQRVLERLAADSSPPQDCEPERFPVREQPPTIPGYEIERELGRGGMGTVYLAQNCLMGRHEVLKLVNSHLLNRPGVLERFLREIRAVAKLRHPNIVTAHHATRLDESIIFAMEYVDGLDLSRLVKTQGPMPVDRACLCIHQAALGLQHAHEKGLVHRDIKPHNLMLSDEEDKATIKILDFGLAKAAREEKCDGELTTEGQALGTPDYVAPEQILDAPGADIRADIYSLGATLYYLLAGRAPFQAKSLYDLYQAHISRDADPLNHVRPAVPVELAALVAKMMAKEPNRRFQTPGELAHALKPFIKKGSVAINSPGAERSEAVGTNAVYNERETVSTAPRPATDADRLVVSLAQAPGPSGAARWWDRVIGFRESERSPAAARDVTPRRRIRRPLSVVAAVFGVLLFGGTVYVATDKGRIKIVVHEPNAVVKVDGAEVRIEALGAPITLRAGEHALEVKGRDGEFQNRRFIVRRGDNEDLWAESEPLHRRATARRENPPEAAPVPGTGADLSVPPKDVTNSIGMKLVLIPAGAFLMGSPNSDKDATDAEKPQHWAQITRPFYLGATEVTVGQIRRFVEQTGYRTDAERGGTGGHGWNEATQKFEQAPQYTWRNPGFAQTDDHPVVNVSWNDAVAFSDWLSGLDGMKPFDHVHARGPWDGTGYRLPTEAEWEYACRAGTTTRYHSGDDPETVAAVGNIADGTARAKFPNWTTIAAHDGYVYTAPVGRFRANAFGLYDMHGNVWEWCWDWYEPNYYKTTPGADPLNSSKAAWRVFRGGSLHCYPQGGSAFRYGYWPAHRSFNVGFRVARVQSSVSQAEEAR